MEKHLISLPKKYYLVIGDKFELFYRGVIRMHNPYQYYCIANCDKGYTYNRYYTYTPVPGDEGEYKLTISLVDDFGEVIESKETILVVNKVSDTKPLIILCIGDSLTYNGVWPMVGYKRYSEIFPNKLSFIGKMKKEEDGLKIGYEGYGGWQWKTFASEYNNSYTSSVWVTCKHNLDDSSQHTIWKCNDLLWVLETIEKDKLKFKRGEGNNKVNPELSGQFEIVSNDRKLDNITIDSYEYSEGNPFFNKKINDIDFKYYVKENGFNDPDLVFILLTWNGQYKPYNTDFSIHSENSQKIIRNIHASFPKAKIGLLGIQLPCPNGGITACYGANGYYYDWYGETITAFNYNEWLEGLANNDEYKDYVRYFDIKSLFDSEYNYWTKDSPVNNRQTITERIGVNGLHPNMNGYLQIGDAFYKALVSMIKELN